MNVAIEIPDDIGRVLAAQAGGLSSAVLEAVAVEAYRTEAITAAQVEQMLGLRSIRRRQSATNRNGSNIPGIGQSIVPSMEAGANSSSRPSTMADPHRIED